VEKGIDVMMVNALKHNNVFKVLEGKPVEGTVIKKD